MYETGALVAFLLWCYTTAMMVVNLNSQAARNLRKVGLRYRWSNLQPVRMEADDYHPLPVWTTFKVLIYCALGIVSIIFSWLSVFYSFVMIVHSWSKATGKPAAVKELEWRLRNFELTFDQIVEHMAKANGVEGDGVDALKQQMRSEMAYWAEA